MAESSRKKQRKIEQLPNYTAGSHSCSQPLRVMDKDMAPDWLMNFFQKQVCAISACVNDRCHDVVKAIWNRFTHLQKICPCCANPVCVAACAGRADFGYSFSVAESSSTGLLRNQAQRDFVRFFVSGENANPPSTIECLGCFKFLQQEVCAHICRKKSSRSRCIVHAENCKSSTECVWSLVGHKISFKDRNNHGTRLTYKGCKNGGPKSNNTVRVCIDCQEMYINSRRCNHMLEETADRKRKMMKPVQEDEEEEEDDTTDDDEGGDVAVAAAAAVEHEPGLQDEDIDGYLDPEVGSFQKSSSFGLDDKEIFP